MRNVGWFGRVPSAGFAALLLVLAMAAGGQAQAPTKVRVGIIPIADVLPLYAAIDMGYFRDEALDVEAIPLRGGAVILPAISGGSVEIGLTNVVSLLLAREQGFDYVIVADDAYTNDSFQMFVRKDAPFTRYRDLVGRKVATNTINNIAWMYIRELVARDGGDPAALQWVEVPFPQMIPALLHGQVDAINVPEPFTTQARQNADLRFFGYQFSDLRKGGILAHYVASKKWVDQQPAVVERFARAHARGIAYLVGNPEAARSLLSKRMRMPEPLTRDMQLPLWRARVDMENLQWTAELMLKHGLLKTRQNVEASVHSTAR